MLLAELVETSRRVGETARRREKIRLLAELLRNLSPEEIAPAIAFLSGSPRQKRLGIGPAALQAAAAEPTPEPSLTLRRVDDALEHIAEVSGPGSAALKTGLLKNLFAQATAPEQEFLQRLLMGELRQGALEGLMVEAVARAVGLPAQKVRRALMFAGDLAEVARAALVEGSAGLDRYRIQLFRPVQPMLAQPAEDLDEALGELGDAALEFKLDGARIQVHKAGGEVRIFSRRLNDVTAAVPEIVEAVRALPAREAVLDGEAIALKEDGRPQPFQVTMRRFGRRLDVEQMRRKLPLRPYWFDLIYLDGGDVIDEPQARRFELLQGIVPPETVIPHRRAMEPGAAEQFLREAVERGHEGIMAKSPEAPYEAGSRGRSWLKIKPAHTLDLVVLAAEWGHGRRRGWLSNLHLGARDIEKGGFVMVGKTFKGLTDEMLAWQTEQLQKLEVHRDEWTVYVEPKLVVEVEFNDVQASPRYPGGVALRFARVKRYRPDKSPAETDTLQALQALAPASS